jgi:Trypsin-like peptidase domain
VSDRRFSANSDLDLAFLQCKVPSTHQSFFPILTPSKLRVGEDVYTYGFFALTGKKRDIEQGYFAGRIVNFNKTASGAPLWSLTLPYPMIEGMSGSPVLTYHNGPKLVGLGYGNRSTRILASEVVQYEDSNQKVREEINRIVEFGLAYHAATLNAFLVDVGATGYLVSDQAINIAGL